MRSSRKMDAQVQYTSIKVKKKKITITRYGAVFILINDDKVFLRQRPDSGLLGGMMEFPGTLWE